MQRNPTPTNARFLAVNLLPTHGQVGKHTIYQVRRSLRHAPGTARRAKAPALAVEGQQLVVPAISAAQVQESVGQDAALEEGLKLVFDKLRQVGASSVFGLPPFEP